MSDSIIKPDLAYGEPCRLFPFKEFLENMEEIWEGSTGITFKLVVFDKGFQNPKESFYEFKEAHPEDAKYLLFKELECVRKKVDKLIWLKELDGHDLAEIWVFTWRDFHKEDWLISQFKKKEIKNDR